jgi:hypothetical protein
MRLGAWFLGVSLLSSAAYAAVEDDGNEPAVPRLSALPFVGVYSYQNVDRKSYRPGPRAGALLGVRLLPWLSLNGEVTYDKSWIQSLEGDNPSEAFVDFALAPLFHWTPGRADVVIGPELGTFKSWETYRSMATGTQVSGSSSGLVVGLNAGAFARVNRYVSLGGMLSFEVRHAAGVDDGDLVALTFAALL